MRLKDGMKHKILIVSLAAGLALSGFLATKAFAANESGGFSGRGRMLQRLADRLDLTADQRAKIKSILLGEREHLKPLLIAVHDSRSDLRSAIRAGEATEASVRAASAKVAAAEADMAVERMELYRKIAPLLTAGQLQKAADLQAGADALFDSAIARLDSGVNN